MVRAGLEKDPHSLEARYQLGLCHFAQRDYPAAAELLEAVYAEKPEHDYGMTYLRLAESQQYCGNLDRAAEVYRTMLQFYPGHPEGEYHYALLLSAQNAMPKAQELMRRDVHRAPQPQFSPPPQSPLGPESPMVAVATPGRLGLGPELNTVCE